MSVTETQLIHRVVPPTTRTRFLLPKENEPEDLGLVMLLDNKMKENPPRPVPVSTTLRTPGPAQLCGQTQGTPGWTTSLLQVTHISFIKLTHQINLTIQKKASQMLPFLLYVSLLVLALQATFLLVLFAMSCHPTGIWFQLACIVILGVIFCHTAVPTGPSPSPTVIPAKSAPASSS